MEWVGGGLGWVGGVVGARGGRGEGGKRLALKRSATSQILAVDDAVSRRAYNPHVLGKGDEEVDVGDDGEGQDGRGVRPEVVDVAAGGRVIAAADSIRVAPEDVPFSGLVGLATLLLLAMRLEMFLEAGEQQHGEADQDADDHHAAGEEQKYHGDVPEPLPDAPSLFFGALIVAVVVLVVAAALDFVHQRASSRQNEGQWGQWGHGRFPPAAGHIPTVDGGDGVRDCDAGQGKGEDADRLGPALQLRQAEFRAVVGDRTVVDRQVATGQVVMAVVRAG